MSHHAAVCVDGENISADFAPQILRIAGGYGTPALVRVYGNAALLPRWCATPGFLLVHTGTGRNATDMMLAIDAMEIAMERGVRTFVLASSDRDFTHLATRLRERGSEVIGIGEAKAPDMFRAACSRFHQLPGKPARAECALIPGGTATQLDLDIRSVIKAHGEGAKGMRMDKLNPVMRTRFGTSISAMPEKTWRGYFGKRDDLYQMDPKGPEARVRFLPQGFASCCG